MKIDMQLTRATVEDGLLLEREKELTVVIHENTKPNAIHDMDNTHIEAIGRQVISLIMQIQQSIKETDGRQQAN